MSFNKCTLPAIAWILCGLTACQAVAQTDNANSAPPLVGSRPNILLIMADDLGYSDLGCYGGEIHTPNLDSLAERGLRFTQFYNTARCWPTRASLMTGFYAQHVRRDQLAGIPSGGGGRRPEWAVMLPKMLQPAGYRSYHVGKWHLDGEPEEAGFDRTALSKSAGRYFARSQPSHSSTADAKPYYVTREMASRAIEDLRDHAENFADRPFFQYIAFTAPHFPLHALPEDIAVYADRYLDGWDVVREQRWQRMQQLGLLSPQAVAAPSAIERELGPPYHFPDALPILGAGEVNRPLPWGQLTAEQQRFQATKMAIHAAMVHRMDLEIGRVLKQLDAMGVRDNTLIMFLSDNGASAEIMVRGDGHDPQAALGSAATYLCLGPGWSSVCNTPFRRHKTWTHEGGISTPFVAAWPKAVQTPGGLRDSPQHVIDVVATLLEATAGQLHRDAPPLPGASFLAELGRSDQTPQVDTQQGDEKSAERSLWWYHDEHRAMRRGDWKAVAAENEPWELFNLATDRGESIDLALPRADKLAELTSAWAAMHESALLTASADLSSAELERAARRSANSGMMATAQAAARIQRPWVLCQAEELRVNNRHAFIMMPEHTAALEGDKPWIFYAPTLSRYPDRHETWMHQQFLDAGVAVAGIDVGEAYGSPHSQTHFDALVDTMVAKGYRQKPALLGRSRGGLYVMRYALERPERVAGIGCIYPVFDYTSYPGVQRAAAVYGVSPEELETRQTQFNPVKRASELARNQIPMFILHGTEDKVVPIEPNSAAVEAAYEAAGQGDKLQLLRVPGQGHNTWEGFFQSQPLVDFLIQQATRAAQ